MCQCRKGGNCNCHCIWSMASCFGPPFRQLRHRVHMCICQMQSRCRDFQNEWQEVPSHRYTKRVNKTMCCRERKRGGGGRIYTPGSKHFTLRGSVTKFTSGMPKGRKCFLANCLITIHGHEEKGHKPAGQWKTGSEKPAEKGCAAKS